MSSAACGDRVQRRHQGFRTVMLNLVSSLPPTRACVCRGQVDCFAVEAFQPGVVVAFGEPQEQALHFTLWHSTSTCEGARPEIAQTIHQDIDLVKCLALWNLIKQSRMARSAKTLSAAIPNGPRAVVRNHRGENQR